ncbi:Alpha/beta hydrolase domain-containing protein 13 [Tolypocladium ophioglossoides CBS 100239]|uniref:Alpha/beta hydrolase domain-containing protein 13 n=1 Tax=Tolypocladium ophioglossoides (strain CBS 100239) TaxID=1163406 RepID=A0A0L0NAL3_TOLOC|nr:Alpha/beta hydrolase domain-containing protein 13 [Tolypocladium ophioglossoides CBS 100239]
MARKAADAEGRCRTAPIAGDIGSSTPRKRGEGAAPQGSAGTTQSLHSAQATTLPRDVAARPSPVTSRHVMTGPGRDPRMRVCADAMRWLRPSAHPRMVLTTGRNQPSPARWPCTASHAQGTLLLRRRLHLPTAVMPPLIFTGLFVALWCWKCTMLVLFQNAIIYNPFLPPNSRSMRIADFARECGGIEWREERIRSLDGTEIALCVSEVSSRGSSKLGSAVAKTPVVYLLYFQDMSRLTVNPGNTSSLPPRLPDISWILRRLKDADEPIHCTTVCLSYRGYWTSHDRPFESGINKDAQATLQWISQLHRSRAAGNQLPKPVVVLWGQSIGCGFATNLAAMPNRASNLDVGALILETPFTNTRAMLQALYPQRWLPYQYLWPFLRNHLDSWKNLGLIAAKQQARLPEVYIVEAAKDELVPQEHGTMLYQRCQDAGLMAERHKIQKALHNDVIVRQEGKRIIAQSISQAVARANRAEAEQKQPQADSKDGYEE